MSNVPPSGSQEPGPSKPAPQDQPVQQDELVPQPPAPGEAEPRKAGYPWRLFFILAAMMLVSSLLILPYSIQLARVSNPEIGEQVPLMIAGTILQAVLLYLPILLLGLLVSRQLELGAPYLHAISEGRPAPSGFRRALVTAAVVGFGLGVLLLLLAVLFSRMLPAELTQLEHGQLPNALQGFLASISAGINEEILLRLFLLSLIAWVLNRVTGRRGDAVRSTGRPGAGVLWAANILAAVIFGLLHLPNLALINVPITPVIVLYVIIMNGMAGLGFGWLFWTFGLESAMLAHFFTDIVLHVIPVLFV